MRSEPAGRGQTILINRPLRLYETHRETRSQAISVRTVD